MPLPLTLTAAFERWEAVPGRIAFHDERGDLGFDELLRRARDVADRLLGIERWAGRPVAYLGRQRNEFYVLLLAAAYAGVPMTGLNWRLAEAELHDVLAAARPGLLVVEPDFLELARAAARNAVPLAPTIVAAAGVGALEGDLPPADRPVVRPTIEPDDGLLLVYTSGTTGRPKGVLLSHRNVMLSADAFAEVAQVDEASRILVQAPTFHVSGNVFGIQAPLQGGVAYLVPTSSAHELVELIRTNQLTHINLVPTLLRAVLAEERSAPGSLASVRCIVYGAAPIDGTLLREATALLDCGFAQSFGLSEAVGVVTMLAPRDHDVTRPELLDSLGTALRGTDLRVVDPSTGADVAPGDVGELWAKGPRIMLGYYEDPDATAAAITAEGWLRTGDLVSMRDGYVYLRGRLKDMIISGGENVYAVEVENALLSHPSVVEAAVIGRPHEKWGEVPTAFVVVTTGVTGDELREHCRASLAGYKVPAEVRVLPELPHNAVGKVVKDALRAGDW